jgi:hypothetical protein
MFRTRRSKQLRARTVKNKWRRNVAIGKLFGTVYMCTYIHARINVNIYIYNNRDGERERERERERESERERVASALPTRNSKGQLTARTFGVRNCIKHNENRDASLETLSVLQVKTRQHYKATSTRHYTRQHYKDNSTQCGQTHTMRHTP